MASILLCSTPVYGHLAPMLEIGRRLVEHGHRVRMVTGSRFTGDLVDAGIFPIPLEGVADFDDRQPDTYLPDRDRFRGIAQAQYDIQRIFIETIPEQHAAVTRALGDTRPDVVLADCAFGGVVPLLTNPSRTRPPVFGVGVLPLGQVSRDVAPAGLGMKPSASPLGRVRNRALTALIRHVLFRRTQTLARNMVAQTGAPPLRVWAMDYSRAFDRFLQLTVPEFEYPRSDLAPNTEFIGPVLSTDAHTTLPDWWDSLDRRRPVVYVTQGTIDNHDPGRLILPTIQALRGREVTLIVTTGSQIAGDTLIRNLPGGVPDNVRVASFLPYARLLPIVDLMITNGGYGGVQHALAQGIPLIAAGDREDKPEVCARISYSGAGINLRTGEPTAEAVGTAAERVLTDPRYRASAEHIARSIARHDPHAAIEQAIQTSM